MRQGVLLGGIHPSQSTEIGSRCQLRPDEIEAFSTLDISTQWSSCLAQKRLGSERDYGAR